MRSIVQSSAVVALSLATLLLPAGGCHVSASVEPPPPSHKAPQTAWVRTDLYFGLNKRGGPTITEDQWNKFVDEQITPRFPDGFTVTSGQGHYLQDGQVILEPSKVVTIMHHPGGDADQRIDAMVKDYVQRFQQDSVLRSDQGNDVRFIGR